MPHGRDKRELSAEFQQRLKVLIERRNETLTGFAKRCGLDRSALSQFLDPGTTRLPRAEALVALAASENVSIDWLLGLSQSESAVAEVAGITSIEAAEGNSGETRLAEWHREAIGYKIRYVPSTLPDLLRTKAVIEYEFKSEKPVLIDAKNDQAEAQLTYSRLPETEMEVVMPWQRLYSLASGSGIWSGLQRGVRQAQLEQMAHLLDELYPTFRLFLFDGVKAYSAPFTVFGPKRAAVYLGGVYLVINSVEQIRQLSMRFDQLIRISAIGPDRASAFVSQLKVI
ncbi:MAG: helix-turn-helix transcriptional regulator [Nitratireductor sp.]|nr:helix-turn-helix transcriptional regulator [Nitratireductor sp.]MCB1460486.1 helix-turn-helix transcriptional regulator [Nitratireductor sp.]